MELSNMISSAEFARRLGCDRSTITRQVKAGELIPAEQLAGYRGDLLFEPDYVDQVVAERRAS